MSDPIAIILAAGKGTRMKSELPKVMHAACGRPMIENVLDAAREAGVKRLVVVVGYKAEFVRDEWHAPAAHPVFFGYDNDPVGEERGDPTREPQR